VKIACVTPFFEGNSVGAVAERIGLAMRDAGHDVLLVGTGRPPYWETSLPLLPAGEYARVHPSVLREYDAVVYHVGNHPSSSPMLWLMERVPGIVVLHDRFYADAYYAYAAFLGKPSEFSALAVRYYGSEGASFAWRFPRKDVTTEEMHRYTFLEPLLECATGAVVHYEQYGEQIRALTDVPVQSSHRPGYPIVKSNRRELRAGAEFVLTYVGCVTRHRCLPLLFEVLHARPDLLGRMRVVVVGLIEDPHFADSLQSLARELGIEDAVHWAFNATDELKHELLSVSDAAFNCRTLNSEGLSGSLMEQMTHGLPVIVNASGFALEAPADAVCFVEQHALREGIERELEALINDPVRRRAIGERARAWADAHAGTVPYADAVARMAEEVGRPATVGTVSGRIRGIFDDMNLRDPAIRTNVDRLVTDLLGRVERV
jgi:glycosyltransferase involved in cell wall biosynthesis